MIPLDALKNKEEKMKEAREHRNEAKKRLKLSDLKVGEKYQGVVVNLTEYGAFVNFGAC